MINIGDIHDLNGNFDVGPINLNYFSNCNFNLNNNNFIKNRYKSAKKNNNKVKNQRLNIFNDIFLNDGIYNKNYDDHFETGTYKTIRDNESSLYFNRWKKLKDEEEIEEKIREAKEKRRNYEQNRKREEKMKKIQEFENMKRELNRRSYLN